MMTFDIAEVERWPVAAKALLCAATGAVVLALGHLLVLAELRSERAAIAREQVALRAEHESKALAAAALPGAQADRDAAAATFNARLRGLPMHTEVPGLIAQISRAAEARSVAVAGVTLAEERATPLYVEQPIDLSVVGDYHAIGAFASDIAALPMLVTWHDFAIERAAADAADGARLVMTATVNAYRRSPAAAAPLETGPGAAAGTGTATAPATVTPAAVGYRQGRARNPFAPSSPKASPGDAGGPNQSRVRHPLEHHPLAQLRLVGTLAAHGVRHALVHTPDGRVHRVAAGDHLGTDHGRIRAVHEAGIELVETVRDGAGRWRKRPRTVEMAVPAAEGDPRQGQDA